MKEKRTNKKMIIHPPEMEIRAYRAIFPPLTDEFPTEKDKDVVF